MNDLNTERQPVRINVVPHIRGKRRKAPYIKPKSVKALEEMVMETARQKHPTFPFLIPRIFRDDSLNGLTQCIVKYIVLCGDFATRINNQGTWSKKLNSFIPGTSRRRLADVMATYNELSLHIEVKVGKDLQSEAQKKLQFGVIRSGGHYYLAHNFTEFKKWFDLIKL